MIDISNLINALEKINNKEDVIQTILYFVQKVTKFHSVAIRLKDGDDYPYYTTLGFSGYFVKAENFLCKRDKDGSIVRDKDLNPCLDCMCGKVIRGQVSPELGFITNKLSFASNNTTELLRTFKPEDKGSTRNRCNAEGYESVLLVPIPYGDTNIGLIQLNDFKTNMITDEVLQFVETLAMILGFVFHKLLLAEENKKEKKQILSHNIKLIVSDIQNKIQKISNSV